MKKRMIVAFFCLLLFMMSIYTICSKKQDLSIQKVNAAKNIGKNIPTPQPKISAQVFDKIENFKKKFDSNITSGLRDSIAMFEKIYQSQSKK